jgi:hypothetical protein
MFKTDTSIFNCKPGGQVRFINANGYPGQLESAQRIFYEGEILTIKSVEINAWNSLYEFEEYAGHWNTVMFEPHPEPEWATIELGYN